MISQTTKNIDELKCILLNERRQSRMGCSSEADCLPSKPEALGSILRIEEN
jgi:hypothetical protein